MSCVFKPSHAAVIAGAGDGSLGRLAGCMMDAWGCLPSLQSSSSFDAVRLILCAAGCQTVMGLMLINGKMLTCPAVSQCPAAWSEVGGLMLHGPSPCMPKFLLTSESHAVGGLLHMKRARRLLKGVLWLRPELSCPSLTSGADLSCNLDHSPCQMLHKLQKGLQISSPDHCSSLHC